MKKTLHLLLYTSLIIVVSACSAPNVENTEDSQNDDALSDRQEVTQEEVIRETKNVSYTGIIRPAGMSIYMEGTHRLVMDDGKFILLESKVKDLNGYVDEEVKVLGAIRPTVETDAMIMRVEAIELVTPKKEETTEKAIPEPDADTKDDGAERAEVVEAESSSSEPAIAEDEIDDPANTTPPVLPSTPESSEPSPALLSRMKKMSSETFTPENWSQQYCTEHIGFCIPVHRNWWYKSFGATSTSYWHVELSSESIENLGDGPIVVVLNGESLTALQMKDGSIHTEGSAVVGYRSWTNGRHFEVRADSSLRTAVEYLTANLQTHE